jgi:hypothetical protein
MKKLLLILSFIAITAVSFGQTFTSQKVSKALVPSEKLMTYKTSSPSIGDFTVPLTIKTPALQLTFTQVEKIDGNWKLTTPLYVGYSYIFSYANGVVHQDSSITIENKFFFGGGINAGVIPNPNGDLIGSIPIGAIVGYSRYGLFGGVNVLDGKPLIGVSINLLNVPILQRTTRFTLK